MIFYELVGGLVILGFIITGIYTFLSFMERKSKRD